MYEFNKIQARCTARVEEYAATGIITVNMMKGANADCIDLIEMVEEKDKYIEKLWTHNGDADDTICDLQSRIDRTVEKLQETDDDPLSRRCVNAYAEELIESVINILTGKEGE